MLFIESAVASTLDFNNIIADFSSVMPKKNLSMQKTVSNSLYWKSGTESKDSEFHSSQIIFLLKF